MPRWPRRWGSALAFPRSNAAHAQVPPDGLKWRHAVSTFGDIKYPPDFKRFDYVNPDAPKGGVARLFELGTYDSFNIVIAGVKGSVPGGIARIYESLMDSSLDEPDSYYGTMAEAGRPIPTIFPT